MPTLDQIPAASQAISPADEIMVSQDVGGVRVTGKATVGTLIALLASQGLLPGGFISGQGAPASSLGEDGWTYLNASTGDVYQRAAGVWTKTGNIAGPEGPAGPAQPTFAVPSLSTVDSIGSSDLIPIGQNGSTVAVSYATLLDSETIDELTPASAAAQTDTFLTGQNSSTLVRQTLSAVWTLIASLLPSWHRPVVELTTNTTLDGSVHNNAILVVSQPITITPAATMASGFSCDIINVSGSSVTLGAGFTTSNASNVLPSGETARVQCAVYSGGTLYFATLSAGSGGSAPAAPGEVSALSATATTSSSVTLSWTAPASGGQVTSYAVNYRTPSGSGSWTAAAGSPGSASATTFTVSGLSASTAYDFEVIAQNSAGAGTAAVLSDISTAAAGTAPGAPTDVAASGATASTMTVSWGAPASGGAVSGYSVYYRVTGTTSWTLATASLAASATSYVVTGLSASTSYDFYVAANSTSNGSTASATVTASTAAGGNYLLTLAGTGGNNLQPGATLTHGQGGIVCQININTSATDGSYTAPASVFFAWGANNTTAPTTGLQSTYPYSPDGSHNLMVQYLNAPATAGSDYLWALAFDIGSNLVASFVWPGAFTIT